MAASVDLGLLGGPVPALVAYDAAHHTDYVATLRSWLRYHGEPRRAARELLIHPNTLRYRMRRIREVLRDAGNREGAPGLAELDLDDPDQRLALQVQVEATWRRDL
jgi:DNA-binding PucR family transcriptional regulator